MLILILVAALGGFVAGYLLHSKISAKVVAAVDVVKDKVA